jgi:hypothetical protein
MKRLSFVLVFVLLAASSFAQRGGKIAYKPNCPKLQYCRDCGDQKAVFLGKLKTYFEKQINFRDLDIIEGVIVIGIKIDSVGNVCVSKFHNRTANTPEEINRLQLANIVNGMPQWEPAVVNGVPMNAYVWLAIYSHVDKHGVFDVGYLRNDKDKTWYVVNSNNEKMMMFFDDTPEKTSE